MKGNKLEKKKTVSGTCGYKRIANINMIGIPEEEEKEVEAEKILTYTMAKKNPQIWQKRKLQIK